MKLTLQVTDNKSTFNNNCYDGQLKRQEQIGFLPRVLYISIFFLIITNTYSSASDAHLCTNTLCLENSTHPSVLMVISTFPDGSMGQSTGFFINNSGDVITTYHSVHNAMRLQIISNKTLFEVQGIKQFDSNSDIAILALEIRPESVKAVAFAKHQPLKGDKVYIIGHPQAKNQTISQGIVSSLYKVIDFDNLIQFTAPIKQGSSGSPLFNANGEVVGIASFMLFTGGVDTLNFAIPLYHMQTQ